ncbi:MAG: DUF805 domain-containing protein [Alphaproteobacteria bacterium]|nr:DUF805 domain-containing protein [Alphaproteobacteria bacterium]
MNLLFGFKGRIGRGKWWLCQILGIVLAAATAISLNQVYGVDFDLSQAGPEMRDILAARPAELLAICVIGFGLAFWINLASTIKRFHDHDQSGVWVLAGVIPVPFDQHLICAGQIWVLVQCGLRGGTPQANRFGTPENEGAAPEMAAGYSEVVELRPPASSGERLAAVLRRPAAAYGSVKDEGEGRRERAPSQPASFGQRRSFGRHLAFASPALTLPQSFPARAGDRQRQKQRKPGFGKP